MKHGLPLAVCVGHWEVLYSSTNSALKFAHHLPNIKHKGSLAKVSVHNFPGRLQADRWVELGRQVSECHAQVMPVFGVETNIVNQVNAAPDHITCRESWTIGVPTAGGTERVAIIAVIAKGVLVPTRQAVHVDALR